MINETPQQNHPPPHTVRTLILTLIFATLTCGSLTFIYGNTAKAASLCEPQLVSTSYPDGYKFPPMDVAVTWNPEKSKGGTYQEVFPSQILTNGAQMRVELKIPDSCKAGDVFYLGGPYTPPKNDIVIEKPYPFGKINGKIADAQGNVWGDQKYLPDGRNQITITKDGTNRTMSLNIYPIPFLQFPIVPANQHNSYTYNLMLNDKPVRKYTIQLSGKIKDTYTISNTPTKDNPFYEDRFVIIGTNYCKVIDNTNRANNGTPLNNISLPDNAFNAEQVNAYWNRYTYEIKPTDESSIALKNSFAKELKDGLGSDKNTVGTYNINKILDCDRSSQYINNVYVTIYTIKYKATKETIGKTLRFAGHNDYPSDRINQSFIHKNLSRADGIPLGYLSGKVTVDVNGDGVNDSSEPTVSKLPVYLYRNNKQVKETVTDSDGKYLFAGLEDGNYEVRFCTDKNLVKISDPNVENKLKSLPSLNFGKQSATFSTRAANKFLNMSGQPRTEGNLAVVWGEETENVNASIVLKPVTHPKIRVIKYGNGYSTSGKGSPHKPVGATSSMSFIYEVTNTGDESVTVKSVHDSKLGDIKCPKTLLQPGEKTLCKRS